jgi:hypothetical protein
MVNENTRSGVFVHFADAPGYHDVDDGAVLDFLASNLYSGRGAHSMFMKTWAAGLAYSNGLRVSISTGTLIYYAERCPELPQTLGFVIDQLRRAEPAADLGEYAVALSFPSRAAAGYEDRAEAMADDLADGVTPEIVRAFRERILALRKLPDLTAMLVARMQDVYGKVLPGYGRPGQEGRAVLFTSGPTRQLDQYATFLGQTVQGKAATLQRLYPRDFWQV